MHPPAPCVSIAQSPELDGDPLRSDNATVTASPVVDEGPALRAVDEASERRPSAAQKNETGGMSDPAAEDDA